VGIDIGGSQTMQVTSKMIDKADLVVALGVDPGTDFPGILDEKILNWDIPDPLGGDLDVYRETREVLRKKIIDLIIELSRSKTT